jgi:chemotaxis protein histidine kinase CheA
MKRSLQDINSLIDRISQIRTFFRPKRKYENKMLINSIQNLIRNLASDMEKDVELKHSDFNGEDIPYKHRVLVKDVMVELIRNSILHGIESADERKKMKKPQMGVLEICSKRENSHFSLVIHDDGRGIQENKIRAEAEQLGLHEKMDFDTAELSQLIFISDISTADEKNSIFKGNFGLSSIKQLLENIDGRIDVKSESGKFCEFKITIPVENN